jgi:hypothetical protein
MISDAELTQIGARLQATQIALDDAIVTRMVHEPWRIAEALYGSSVWPPLTELTDHLLLAEQEHRWRLRLYRWERHPRVHQASLLVNALLRMVM